MLRWQVRPSHPDGKPERSPMPWLCLQGLGFSASIAHSFYFSHCMASGQNHIWQHSRAPSVPHGSRIMRTFCCQILVRLICGWLKGKGVWCCVQVCRCQVARYCSQDCQYRHWGVHKPVCKAARESGGIKQEQAMSFMLSA